MEQALELITQELIEQRKLGWDGESQDGWSKGYDAGWARGMEHALFTLRCAIEDQKKGVNNG